MLWDMTLLLGGLVVVNVAQLGVQIWTVLHARQPKPLHGPVR